MRELLDAVLNHLAGGNPVALCTLVRSRGSTPQAVGAAMAVFGNGQTLGTLGGGCVEAEVITRALRLLHSDGVDTLVSFKLDHDFGWDDGLMCGGMMDVAIQILRSSADTASLTTLRDTLAHQRTADLAIRVPDKAGVTQSFIVPIAPRPTLVIAGGGHVGQAIAAAASAIDFEVAVIDDRGDVISETRFPSARRIVGDIETELRRFPITPHTFIVIVTRGHRHDAAALAAVIASQAAYIGMIGSKRKVRTILDGLLREGVDRSLLYRVHAPIGIEIGAITPAEIAVSVAAELIAIRRHCDRERGTTLRIPQDDLDRWLDRDQLQPDTTPDAPR